MKQGEVERSVKSCWKGLVVEVCEDEVVKALCFVV